MVHFIRYLVLMTWMLMLAAPTQAQGYLYILSLSYSPDGEYIAGVGRRVVDGQYVIGEGGRVVVWDGETAQIVADIELELGSEQGLLIDAAWSPDGDRLAVAGTDFRVRILDFSEDAQPIGTGLADFEVVTFMGVLSVAWSPDGSYIVIGGDEVTPRLEFRDGITYDYIGSSAFLISVYRMTLHPDPQRNLIAATNFYMNGAQLASTADDGSTITTRICALCAPDTVAVPLAWNHDGSLLAIGHTDGSIFIVDPITDTIVIQIQAGEYVSELVWTQDSQYLLSLSTIGLQVWDSLTGDLLNSPPFPDAGELASHPFRNDLFIYSSGVGTIVNVASLIEPPPTATLTYQLRAHP